MLRRLCPQNKFWVCEGRLSAFADIRAINQPWMVALLPVGSGEGI